MYDISYIVLAESLKSIVILFYATPRETDKYGFMISVHFIDHKVTKS